jgi:hypothetical protein
MSASLQRHAVGLTWTESNAMARAAHALADQDRVWLIDPFEDEAALSAAAELGRPQAVLQLLDRHNRDCQQIADRLGVPLLRLPASVPDAPFTVVPVIKRRRWNEVALWWPQEQTIVVAEAIGTAPAFALGRRAGIHPLLRFWPPRRALGDFAPERVLTGHGGAIESGGAAALAEAFTHARSDLPRLLRKLPSLLRGG